MSKRFTDTEKWQRPWFRQLPWMYRELWLYILDSCDIAGIWYVDFDLAKFFISQELDQNKAIELFKKQIRVFDDGKKWWVEGFCDFQYGILSSASNLHKSVLSRLQKAGIDPTKVALEQGLNDPTSTHMDKVKDKDKDKDKVKEKEQDVMFSQFWLSYPRKDDKSSSRKAWSKIDVTEDLLKIILLKLQAEKQSDQWNRDNGQYIPLPTTWLNKKRWENEGIVIIKPSSKESINPKTFFAFEDK